MPVIYFFIQSVYVCLSVWSLHLIRLYSFLHFCKSNQLHLANGQVVQNPGSRQSVSGEWVCRRESDKMKERERGSSEIWSLCPNRMGDSSPILPNKPALFFVKNMAKKNILDLIVRLYFFILGGKTIKLAKWFMLFYSAVFSSNIKRFFLLKAKGKYAQEISLMLCPLAYIYLFI